MGQYLVVRDDGAFVADIYKTGGSSYTRNILNAKRFPSMEAAERDRCPGNEHVASLESYFGG